MLYNKLYRAEDSRSLSVSDYIPALVQEISGIFPLKEFVQISTEIADVPLPANILSSLGIIFNELITNSMKYAFIGRTEGAICAQASCKDRLFTLSHSDTDCAR